MKLNHGVVLGLGLSLLVSLGLAGPAGAQVADLATGHIPTLAPLVKQVTPAVVNISVQGRIREDNPLYQDPMFREFFDVPRQLEKEFSATGSGVIVDAQRGFVLTANHVVAHASNVQITTKDGRKFAARLVGRDAPTDIALLEIREPNGLKAIRLGDSDALQVGELLADIGQFLLAQRTRLPAMRAVFQLQQLADFVEGESEFLRVADEAQPLDMILGVAPDAARRARRLADQPTALVVADGFQVHAGPPG